MFERDTRDKQLCMGYGDSGYAGDLNKRRSMFASEKNVLGVSVKFLRVAEKFQCNDSDYKRGKKTRFSLCLKLDSLSGYGE